MSIQKADPREFGFPEPDEKSKQYRDYIGEPDGRVTEHTDAHELRMRHGIPPFNPDKWEYPNLIPNIIQHTWDGGRDHVSGGSEFLATGPMNSGKTTLAQWLSILDVDENDSKLVWRATSGARTEWEAFSTVAHVCIPKGYEAKARLVSKDKSDNHSIPVDLEDVVREVVYYNDIVDLNERVLHPGMFHVVYPDPELRGCQWVYEESEKKIDGLDFVAGRDPVYHWWFGWALSLVERGPYPWITWVCDEVKDIAPEGAPKDEFASHQKVQLLGDAIADFRKNGISAWFFGHQEKHLHNLVRDRIRWRITMNGTANPTHTSEGAPVPVGFGTVKMNTDLTTDMDIGEALVFNEENFEGIEWDAVESWTSDYDLQVSIVDSSSSSAEPQGVTR